VNAEPSLRIAGISRRVGALVALDDVSFEIMQGEVFGLLGPNGAGKTMLIRIVVGLLAQDAGREEFAGSEGMPRSRLIGESRRLSRRREPTPAAIQAG
jgi:ABC-2 type transport system ATP-binding protein